MLSITAINNVSKTSDVTLLDLWKHSGLELKNRYSAEALDWAGEQEESRRSPGLMETQWIGVSKYRECDRLRDKKGHIGVLD
jgi:hypothetical protein